MPPGAAAHARAAAARTDQHAPAEPGGCTGDRHDRGGTIAIGTSPADRVLRGAARDGAVRLTALAAVTVAAAGTALLLPAALGHTLDLLLATGRDGAPGGGAADPAGGATAGRATAWTLGCAALIVLTVALDGARTVLTATAQASAAAGLRRRLLDRVLAGGPAAAVRFAPGELATRGTVNAAHAAAAPATAATAVAGVLTPVGAMAALALIDYRLALAFVAGAPLLLLLLRAFARSTADCVARYQRVQGELAARLTDALTGARAIAAAGAVRREGDRVLGPLAGLSREGHRMWRLQGRAAAQAAALVPLLLLTVVAAGGLLLAAGELSVGGLLAAARYAALAAGVGALVGQLAALVRGRGAAARLAEAAAIEPVRYGTAALPPGPGALEFRRVTASRGGRPVLRGVDLTVPGGSTVAVVGRSGSGKSLLAALAGRLADPDDGVVLLDGVPLPELDRDALRREVGYAFERPALLGGTVGGTIGYGPRPVPPDRIAAAARAACADDFVRALPDGYRTRCDRVPLSGGEAQRLGLARAFAHGGRLLVLDDATSSLDTVTELRVCAAVLDGAGDRTRLLVAHRPATAAHADLVVWLEEGRVRAAGGHAELWRLSGYRALWRE